MRLWRAPLYDAVHGALPSRGLPGAGESRYRALGRPVLCRPYAVHPAALQEAACETAEHALGFVGAPTGNRVLRLAGLRLFGCRTEVRGEGWQRTNAAPPRPRPPRG